MAMERTIPTVTTSMRNKLIILLAAIALAGVSCDRKTMYHHYEHVESDGWDKNDTLKFAFSSIEVAGNYREWVELRIDNTYPFMKLTMLVEQKVYPLGKIHQQSVECNLMSSDGHPSGTGISYYHYQIPLTDIELNKGDSLEIHIVHNMKREIMPGITDVGIRLRAQ